MQEKKHWKKNKIASGIGIGIVALVLFIMVFGIGSGNGSYGKWEFSKNTPNELGKWYIRLTKENDPIFKLEVSGEQPEYFIGLDFYVKDNIKGTEWTKVSDGSNMGIDNFNKNLEALLTKYPLIGNFKGKWVVYYNYVDLSELKKKQTVDFCWGELIDGKIHAKIKYEDLDKYLK